MDYQVFFEVDGISIMAIHDEEENVVDVYARVPMHSYHYLLTVYQPSSLGEVVEKTVEHVKDNFPPLFPEPF